MPRINTMDAELRGMVMAFRVTELQTLLSFAGKNRNGRKNELQARTLELVKNKSPQVVTKIRELYKTIKMSTLGQPLSTNNNSSLFGGSATASSLNPSSYGYQNKLFQDTNYGKPFGYQRTINVDGQYRNIPICPDIKMKKLPFYDIQAVLVKPTSLIAQGQAPKQEVQHTFCLTSAQAAEISNSKEVKPQPDNPFPSQKIIQYTVQVQLRFCAVDSSGEEQDDMFPQSLSAKVNGRMIQLPQPIPSNRPGVEPKRPSRPLNITNNVKCCPHNTNTLHVQWVAEANKFYAVSVFIVKKVTAEDLLLRLKNKKIQPPDYTRSRIKEITTADEEDVCAPTSIRVSVACPLGKNRMTYPCKATTCKHLQCFDAKLFLLMNEKKPTFVCPVCNKQLKFEDLTIDGYFMEVIEKLSLDAGNDIEVFPDGSWLPAAKVKKEMDDASGPPAKRLKPESANAVCNTTIDVDDDICIVEDVPSVTIPSSTEKSTAETKSAEPELIDLIDSSSSEDEDENDSRKGGTTPAPETAEVEGIQAKETENTPAEDDDDDEEIGIRPRRRKPRVNYVEESSDSSSTNEGDAVVGPASSRIPRSPACIELSDSPAPSPEPRQQQRAFASISANQSRSSSNAQTRSGSDTSNMFTSSGSVMQANPAGIGGMMMSVGHNSTSSTPSFYTQSTYSQSTSSIMNPTASLLYPPTPAVPGYTAYDARGGWDDLNSFLNPTHTFGRVGEPYDYMNMNPTYDPRSTGGSGNYNRWM